MTVLGKAMLARPVPLIHTTTALRARSTFPVLRASEGNNETAPASSKPTIFYGGRSFTESEWSTAVNKGTVAEGAVSSDAVSTQKTNSSPGFADIMAFNGKAPEITNGRLAMLGFLSAVAAELVTGKSTLAQWAQEPTAVTLTFALFIAASLAPIFNRADGKERLGPFTPSAELLNGRAAMIGFAALIGIEAIKGSALF